MRNLVLVLIGFFTLTVFTSCEVTYYETVAPTPHIDVIGVQQYEKVITESNFWGTTQTVTTDFNVTVRNTGTATANNIYMTLYVNDIYGYTHETVVHMDYLLRDYDGNFVVETNLHPSDVASHTVNMQWN